MDINFVVVVLLLIQQALGNEYKNLTEAFTWKILEFGFDSARDRRHAIDTGHYDDPNRFPVGLGVAYTKNGHTKVILTLPRFARESPYSLAIVSRTYGPNGPWIYPYPSYAWQNNDNNNCSVLTSAHRVYVNSCNQMWVIDSGVIKGQQICPPQLFVFDLETDQLIHNFSFPSHLYTSGKSVFSKIVSVSADPAPQGQCERNMAYIADSQQYGLVVYDQQQGAAWRIQNELMVPEPKFEEYTIAGESFRWSCGINGMAIPQGTSAAQTGRNLYFHAFSSVNEVYVNLKDINNQTIWMNNPNALPGIFKKIGSRGVQSFMETIDSKGNLYASTADPLSVFVWNIYSPIETYSTEWKVADNPNQLQFVSGMHHVQHPNGEEFLWVLSARDQKFKTMTFNPNETNFRIMYASTKMLLERVALHE